MSQQYDEDTDFYFYDDSFEDSYYDSQLLKKLRRELTQTKNALKQRDGELSSLKTESRKRTVRDVLESKGLNPKIAAFVPTDVEPNDEAVSAWIDEYGDVFGVVQVASAGSDVSASVDADAIRRMSVVEDAGVSADFANDLLTRINGATSREELMAITSNA